MDRAFNANSHSIKPNCCLALFHLLARCIPIEKYGCAGCLGDTPYKKIDVEQRRITEEEMINLDDLKFKWLLYGLYLLIRFTSWRSGRLRRRLLERDMVIAIRSKDGAVARTIRCKAGKVRSQKGTAEDAVSRITWVNSAAGSRVMLKVAKGRSKALVAAVLNKELLPEGDASGIKWFLDVTAVVSQIYGMQKK